MNISTEGLHIRFNDIVLDRPGGFLFVRISQVNFCIISGDCIEVFFCGGDKLAISTTPDRRAQLVELLEISSGAAS